MGEVMPLTPEDVSNKRFTPVRLREGYDMGEVDQFLDEVESELSRLTKENDDLRSKLSAAQSGSPVSMDKAPEPAKEEKAPEAAAEPAAEAPAAPVVAAASAGETLQVQTVPQASKAAARLLEIAARNADELVDEAKSRGGQDRRRIPHHGRAAGERGQGQGRPRRGRRAPAFADARPGDHRASYPAVR